MRGLNLEPNWPFSDGAAHSWDPHGYGFTRGFAATGPTVTGLVPDFDTRIADRTRSCSVAVYLSPFGFLTQEPASVTPHRHPKSRNSSMLHPLASPTTLLQASIIFSASHCQDPQYHPWQSRSKDRSSRSRPSMSSTPDPSQRDLLAQPVQRHASPNPLPRESSSIHQVPINRLQDSSTDGAPSISKSDTVLDRLKTTLGTPSHLPQTFSQSSPSLKPSLTSHVGVRPWTHLISGQPLSHIT